MSQENTVQKLKLITGFEKKTKTVVDTVMITPELLKKWHAPPFQRPLRENDKVRALAEQLKVDGGVIPGVITLGVLGGETYVIDGQHRLASFQLSGLKEGYTDIRKHFFVDMAAMGEEFVLLNSQLVRMRPDDILRGLESSVPTLSAVRLACPYVGYDQIRRANTIAPVVSMAALLRQWHGSAMETPGHANQSTVELAKSLSDTDVTHLTDFLKLAFDARDRSPAYSRIKATFIERIAQETGAERRKVNLPQPAWQHGTGHVKELGGGA